MTEKNMKYVLGLDIGIGSVGWAVIRDDQIRRIEDFGVRIFDSGESPNGKDRASQARRGFRSTRRLIRRRAHRKDRLKKHLQLIKLTSVDNINRFLEDGSIDMIGIRVKGIDQKLEPVEIAAALIHICNHRGFRDFYALDEDDITDEAERKEYQAEKYGAALIDDTMKKGNYRTVAEMIARDDRFKNPDGDSTIRTYRNRRDNKEHYSISRELYKDEVGLILDKQKEYYSCLTDDAIEKIIDIIFKQRAFEDGPGDSNDQFRKYTGFLDTLGKCRFFKEEDRGSRYTLIADVYTLINNLSQYAYTNVETGEIGINKELAASLIDYAVNNAGISQKEVKEICKKNQYEVVIPKALDGEGITRAFKFAKPMKKILDEAGYEWEQLIGDNYLDTGNDINQLGILLSKNITPSKRIEKLKDYKLKEGNKLEKEVIKKIASQKFSGTTNVSYKYMLGAIEAFKEGEGYGDYQARMNKEEFASDFQNKGLIKLPPFGKEFEFYKNPVVFRSINETRKIINAIIDRYGSPCYINIEVASELNKCYEDRVRDDKRNKENNKQREKAIKEIAELLGKEVSEIQRNGNLIDKYLLGESQGWHCLYSDKPIDKEQCLKERDGAYEIDHIIPFSCVLDDTLNNKALVLGSENQLKKQRTPLMYLDGEKRKHFVGKVNDLFKNKKISEKKYKYLMSESIDDEVVGEWKSRNINDTRYIAKFLVNYLEMTLKFSEKLENSTYRKNVYAVKSAITSKMRRRWLNEKTWGIWDKEELKKVTYLDHAADAVVIANCLPGYVEVAMENMKLRNIYKRSGRKITDEYTDSLNEAKNRICTYYGLDRSYVDRQLKMSGGDRIPSLIDRLGEEVDIRFVDPDIRNYFLKKTGEKEQTPEEIEKIFRSNVKTYYTDDGKFAESIRMPQTSFKIERKYSGQITDSNPISIREIDGKKYKMSRKSIYGLTRNQVDKIYTSNTDLVGQITNIFDKAGVPEGDSKKSIGDILAKNDDAVFRDSNGHIVRTITLFETAATYVTKKMSDGSHTDLSNGEYYCIEAYKDIEGKLCLAGIMYSDLIKNNGKIVFNSEYKYPEKYGNHLMYIFKNEYIELMDNKGRIKEKSGFYKSVYSIKQGILRTSRFNTPCNQKSPLSISSKDTIKKIYYDVLGYKGGEVKCGEQLLSAEAND